MGDRIMLMKPFVLGCVGLVWPSLHITLLLLWRTEFWGIGKCKWGLLGKSSWLYDWVIVEVQFCSPFCYLLMSAWSWWSLVCWFWDLWCVLKGVVLPCGFGYVLAARVPVSSRSVPLLLPQQHTEIYPPDRPGPAPSYLDVFACVYPASPA